MIPVRDVIPSRTAPGVTLAVLAAFGVACAWPEVREWWLPWLAHAVVLWLAGSTVEDRFGHVRFAVFVAACGVAASVAPAAAGLVTTPLWAVGGAVAAVVTAYVVMFPRSRVLMLVPVAFGIEIADAPAWTIFALWALVQAVAAWSALTWAGAPADPVAAALSVAAGAVAGALGGLLLTRPERMRVEWWG